MINIKGKKNLLGWLILLAMFVSCSQGPSSGVELDIISIEPEPIVGQIATVTFEITSNYSTPATISTRFFDVVIGTAIGEYPETETFWQGSLKANDPQEFFGTMCTLYPGTWRLDIGVETPEKLGGSDGRLIESNFDHAEVTSHFEGPAEAEVIVGTVVVQGNNSTPISSEIEDVTETKATVEQTVYLSQECLEANSQP